MGSHCGSCFPYFSSSHILRSHPPLSPLFLKHLFALSLSHRTRRSTALFQMNQHFVQSALSNSCSNQSRKSEGDKRFRMVTQTFDDVAPLMNYSFEKISIFLKQILRLINAHQASNLVISSFPAHCQGTRLLMHPL